MAAVGGKMCWKCGQTKTITIYLGHFFHSDIEIACDLLFVLLMSPVFLLNRFSNFAMHSFIWHTCVCSEQLLFAIFSYTNYCCMWFVAITYMPIQSLDFCITKDSCRKQGRNLMDFPIHWRSLLNEMVCEHSFSLYFSEISPKIRLLSTTCINMSCIVYTSLCMVVWNLHFIAILLYIISMRFCILYGSSHTLVSLWSHGQKSLFQYGIRLPYWIVKLVAMLIPIY